MRVKQTNYTNHCAQRQLLSQQLLPQISMSASLHPATLMPFVRIPLAPLLAPVDPDLLEMEEFAEHVGITVSADLFQYETALAAGWDYGARGPVTRAEDTFPKAHLSKLTPTWCMQCLIKKQ